jgi:hypothetical protein
MSGRNGAMAARQSIHRNEYIIWAAVVVGAFTIPYIITTYVIRHRNKHMGYPVHLPIKNIPLCA